MKNTPGRLFLIAGLPGSGKSRWMATHTPISDFFVADDFMANAYDDVPRFTYSRWYIPLIFALRAGRKSAISDIAFCNANRREEAETVLKDAVDELVCEWVFFEYAPDACRQNIERAALEEGRSLKGRLDALEEWSRKYSIPTGARVERVFRAHSDGNALTPRS